MLQILAVSSHHLKRLHCHLHQKQHHLHLMRSLPRSVPTGPRLQEYEANGHSTEQAASRRAKQRTPALHRCRHQESDRSDRQSAASKDKIIKDGNKTAHTGAE